ncbi:MAG: DMT family transporter, partial [Ignavibacteria bacterium]|nr:DMT family transporter [Ignavibacteria bacterium]
MNTKIKSPSKILLYILLIIGVIILGFSAIFVKWANAPGSVTAFYRILFALIAIALPVFVNYKKKKIESNKKGIIAAILGGFFFGTDLVLWSTGVQIGGMTNPTLMANTAPIWVGLGAIIIFRERLKFLFWFGLFIALIGTILVLGQDLNRASQFGTGTILGLLAGFFYGAYYLATQKGREYLSTLSFFWYSVIGSLIAPAIAVIVFKFPIFDYPLFTWVNFFALGIVVQVIGWLILNYVQGHIPASIIAPTLLG